MLHLQEDVLETEVFDADAGRVLALDGFEEVGGGAADADEGLVAGDAATEAAGEIEVGGEGAVGGDVEALDGVLERVEVVVEDDAAVAHERDAVGDALQVGRDVRRKED